MAADGVAHEEYGLAILRKAARLARDLRIEERPLSHRSFNSFAYWSPYNQVMGDLLATAIPDKAHIRSVWAELLVTAAVRYWLHSNDPDVRWTHAEKCVSGCRSHS